jgi:hypothetical protein
LLAAVLIYLLLYCCCRWGEHGPQLGGFVLAFLNKTYDASSEFGGAAALIRHCCFADVLLLLYRCFSAALLLLYCCFTAALPLLYLLNETHDASSSSEFGGELAAVTSLLLTKPLCY